jgi:hypothetical protein
MRQGCDKRPYAVPQIARVSEFRVVSGDEQPRPRRPLPAGALGLGHADVGELGNRSSGLRLLFPSARTRPATVMPFPSRRRLGHYLSGPPEVRCRPPSACMATSLLGSNWRWAGGHQGEPVLRAGQVCRPWRGLWPPSASGCRWASLPLPSTVFARPLFAAPTRLPTAHRPTCAHATGASRLK